MPSQKLENRVHIVYNQVTRRIIMTNTNKKASYTPPSKPRKRTPKVSTAPKKRSTAKKKNTPKKKVEALQVADGMTKEITKIHRR